jgi:hypothetical protein
LASSKVVHDEENEPINKKKAKIVNKKFPTLRCSKMSETSYSTTNFITIDCSAFPSSQRELSLRRFLPVKEIDGRPDGIELGSR